MKKAILFLLLALCSLATYADTYTDGVAKAIDDSLIIIILPDSPIMDELVGKTYDERKQDAINFIAATISEYMSEDEFKAWLNYHPSKREIKYETLLNEMRAVVDKDGQQLAPFDSVKAMIEMGKEVPLVEVKSCPDSYKQAFNHFSEVHDIFMFRMVQRVMLLYFYNPLDFTQLSYKKAWEIYDQNVVNTILNSYIDHYSERQLKKFSRELPFEKAIHEINAVCIAKGMKLFEATFGMNLEQFEKLCEEKGPALKKKYNYEHVTLEVEFKGIRRIRME